MIVISGSGLYTPENALSNDELVASFNEYVTQYNKKNADKIAAGDCQELQLSDADFIKKASGINSRYVIDKKGILDVERMRPNIAKRKDEDISLQCEMALAAAKQALKSANKTAEDIGAVICGCSNMQRSYPAMAVELQQLLGIDGFAFDMNVACSSATFAIQTAVDCVKAGRVKAALVVNPEICTAHLNFRDRDSHFIFGDAATAVVVESVETVTTSRVFSVIDSILKTKFSNNIRNNAGFLNRCDPENDDAAADLLFVQEGRKVFKEVTPLVSQLLLDFLKDNQLEPDHVKRFWLHQANESMNHLILKKILGREPDDPRAPLILDRYANTSSAGSVIAFHLYHEDLQAGDYGVLCSFGAGYSVGALILECLHVE